ncbi:MAG: peptide chain release factor N(5)-glutamine methyltransferase [Elusimicrobiales bacterium]
MKVFEIFESFKCDIEKLKGKEKEFDIILSEVCELPRFSLWTQPDRDIDDKKIEKLQESVCQRIKHIPLSWILSRHRFLDIDLFIKKGVFVPRPETEELTLIALSQTQKFSRPTLLDFCAGSGAIGIYIAIKNPNATVYGIERSKKAYSVMVENSKRFSLSNYIPILSSKIDALDIRFDVVVSNPPYIPQDMYDMLDDEVKKEPVSSVVSGKDGLRMIRYIASNIEMVMKKGGVFLCEIGEYYTQKITEIFMRFNNFEIIKDMSGKDRFVKVVV